MAENAIVAANRVFATKLLAALVEQQPAANMLISPLSISLALLLAHAGAEGETEHAIARTLGFGQLSRKQAAREANALMRQLTALDEAEAQRTNRLAQPEDTMWLRIANALFVAQDVRLKPAYVQSVRHDFHSFVEALDFGSPAAAQVIDAWVKDQTRGKITDIAGQLDRRTVAVLLNAVYFKAPWLNPFLEHATRDDTFTLRDGTPVQVPMMTNTDRYLYQRADAFEVVGLPFRGNGDLRLLVLLPDRRVGLAGIQPLVFDPATWASLNLRLMQVQLRMPRFRVACDVQLAAPLSQLGMAVAFDPGAADFSGMVESGERVFISEVRHKTYLDVNEQGAEAAAVTAIKMMRTSVIVQPPRQVDVDRPFVCALQDNQTGMLLFVGIIADPRA